MDQEAILKVSLKDYKQQIDDLKGSLLGLESTSEEYQKTANTVKEMQDKLNEVMRVGKDSVNTVSGSYADLSQQLSNLKKEWKNMEIGTEEWNKAAQEINNLNDKLKDADSQVGVFGRNVGNYSQSFSEAFAKAGGSAGKMGTSVAAGAKAANVALKSLAANPIVAVFTALALVINGVVKAFQRNEQAMASLKKAMAPFQAVVVGIQKAFDFLATSLGKAAEAVANFWGKLFGGKEADTATAKIQKIANDELKLSEQQRETTKANADAALEVAELRAKAADKAKYTEAERLSFLQQAGDKEKEIADRAYEDAKLEYEIIKQKNELTESSKQDKDAEAEAYAKMIQAKTDYFKKSKEIDGQMSELRKKGMDEAKKVIEELKKNSQTELQNLTDKYNKEKALLKGNNKALLELQRQYENEVTRIKNEEWRERMEQEKIYYNIYLSQFVNGSSSYYQAVLKGAEKDLSDVKERGEKMRNELDSLAKGTNKQYKTEDEIFKVFGFKSEADLDEQLNELVQKIVITKDNIATALEKEYNVKTQMGVLGFDDREVAQQTRYIYERYRDYYNKLTKLSTETEEDFELRRKQYFKGMERDLVSIYTTAYEQNRKNLERRDYGKLLNGGISYIDYLKRQVETSQKLFLDYGKFVDDFDKNRAIDFALTQGIDLTEYKNDIAKLQEEFDKIFGESAFEGFMKPEDGKGIPSELLDGWMESLRNYVDAEKLLLQERRNNWFDLSASIGDVIGSLGEFYQQDIDNQVKNGKMSEKQAKEEFKKVQALKISQAVIQTISGAIAAFMGCQELGQPWGLALGIAQAAAVTAAGAAQIQQIASQNPYDTSGVSGGIQASTATPKLQDYSPERTANITSLSDETNLQSMLENTNIYVKVSDIDEAQSKGRVRVSESSF